MIYDNKKSIYLIKNNHGSFLYLLYILNIHLHVHCMCSVQHTKQIHIHSTHF